MSKLLTTLNPAQLHAVKHKDGPIQVLSTAGSGKTRIVTRRIAHLIQECGIPPETILAVTFTKKAANEMSSRLDELIGGDSLEHLNIGTFHSACFKILRNEVDWYDPPMKGFRIVEGWQQIRLMRDAIEKNMKASPPLPAEMIKLISRAKNELITPESILESPIPPPFIGKLSHTTFAQAYSLYEEAKRSQHLYDFDDLLFEVYKMLRDNAGIRAAYSAILDYYLIDEFQDTNRAQFEILRFLCGDDGNIMVVADDDQSIYSWRGAIPAYTIEFKDYFPSATVVRMETNYRSCPNIINLASTLIAHNKNRVEKVAVADRTDEGNITVVQSVTEMDEAEFVCKGIGEFADRDIAVLYRTNAQSRALEDRMVKAGIPYAIIGSLGFYNRKEVQDILAYLRVVEFDDDEALRRVINTPSRYLGKAFLAELAEIARANQCSLFKAISKGMGKFSKPYMGVRAREFSNLIWSLKERRHDTSPADMIQAVRDVAQYDIHLLRNQVEGDPDNDRIQNLNELESAAMGFSALREFLTYAQSMQTKGSADSDGDDGKVQLLTLHRAKGLEWDTVFIVGVSERLLPHHRAESVEEERRLMYVGITRARERLYLSSLLTYQGKSVGPSSFLHEAGLSVKQSASVSDGEE